MRKLRVLTVLHDLSLTGAPKIAIDACDALQEEVEPFFVSLRPGPLDERCRRVGQLHILSGIHQHLARYNAAPSEGLLGRTYRTLKKKRSVAYFTRLKKQIRIWQPDVLYVNSIASLEVLDLLEIPGVPVVLHVHELEVITQVTIGANPGLLTAVPTRYIAVSQPVQAMLTDCYQIDADRIALIHEFVPDADFQTPPLRAERKQDGCFVVGGAGHPGWRKGTTPWLQMAVELTRLLKNNVRFVWVGIRDDYESVAFQEEARKLNLEGAIEFVRATKTPLPHYAEFDAFAMTSYEDPCPLVVLENMMLEIPVLCFAGSGGAPEEVGDTGIAVENFSPSAMAAALAALAADPERRRVMGKAARKRVEQHFTAGIQARKILKEFRRLADMQPS